MIIQDFKYDRPGRQYAELSALGGGRRPVLRFPLYMLSLLLPAALGDGYLEMLETIKLKNLHMFSMMWKHERKLRGT